MKFFLRYGDNNFCLRMKAWKVHGSLFQITWFILWCFIGFCFFLFSATQGEVISVREGTKKCHDWKEVERKVYILELISVSICTSVFGKQEKYRIPFLMMKFAMLKTASKNYSWSLLIWNFMNVFSAWAFALGVEFYT